MTHTYYAVEDGEIILEVTAETQGGAEWLVDMSIWQMAKCHQESWEKFGRVVRADEYNKEGVYRHG